MKEEEDVGEAEEGLEDNKLRNILEITGVEAGAMKDKEENMIKVNQLQETREIILKVTRMTNRMNHRMVS